MVFSSTIGINMNLITINVKSVLLTIAIASILTLTTNSPVSAHQPDKIKSLASFEQDNEKIARAFVSALGQKDMRKVSTLLSDNFTFQNGMNPKRQQGKKVFTDWWYSMVNNATLLKPSIERLSVMGTTVLVEGKFHYKDADTDMTFRDTKFIHIKNGKIYEYQEYQLPSNKKMKMKM